MSKYKYICGMFTDDEDGYTIDCDDMAEEYNKLAKEIAELKADLKAKDLLVDCYISVAGTLDNAKMLKAENERLQQQLKDNTKQVCEKIRKNIVKYVYGGNLFDIKGFKEFLDQVEKGE